MTRLEFEQDKTKRLAALAEALKGAASCDLSVGHVRLQAIADVIIRTANCEFETEPFEITIPEPNEKPV